MQMKFVATCLLSLLSVPAVADCGSFVGSLIADGNQDRRALVQIWNPENSGKVIEVRRIDVATTAWLNRAPFSAWAADLEIVTSPIGTAPTSFLNVRCKDTGDTSAPTAQLRSELVVESTLVGRPPIYEFWPGGRTVAKLSEGPSNGPEGPSLGPEDDVYQQALIDQVDKPYTFDPPLRVHPGTGLLVRGAQNYLYVVTSWQWEEVVQ